jgi:hypothetical protein
MRFSLWVLGKISGRGARGSDSKNTPSPIPIGPLRVSISCVPLENQHPKGAEAPLTLLRRSHNVVPKSGPTSFAVVHHASHSYFSRSQESFVLGASGRSDIKRITHLQLRYVFWIVSEQSEHIALLLNYTFSIERPGLSDFGPERRGCNCQHTYHD